MKYAENHMTTTRIRPQGWQLERIREGLADAKAGQLVPHEEVEKWLDSWGTDHELTPPACE